MTAAKEIRVLIVEDDDDFREGVVLPELRTAGGFEVSGVSNAVGLYRSLLASPVDIVVLDVGLPDESGLEVARYLRAHSDVGLVMLTGRAELPDQVAGLQAGADAYLTKPVAMDLLIATLRNLHRRTAAKVETASGDAWRMCAEGWQLSSPGGVHVDLTASERSVLTRLLDQAGKPVDRSELIAQLTQEQLDFDPHRLEMIIHRLRKKVEDEVGSALPLRALRGRGYLFTQPASVSGR